MSIDIRTGEDIGFGKIKTLDLIQNSKSISIAPDGFIKAVLSLPGGIEKIVYIPYFEPAQALLNG